MDIMYAMHVRIGILLGRSLKGMYVNYGPIYYSFNDPLRSPLGERYTDEQNVRDFHQTKLESELNFPFLSNEHSDPRFCFSGIC